MLKKLTFCLYLICLSFLLTESAIFSEDLTKVTEALYGTWNSPITALSASKGSLSRYSQFVVKKNKIYRLEIRLGKPFIVVSEKGKAEKEYKLDKFLPQTKVHEYGGLSFNVEGEKIYFINSEDQRIYILSPEGAIYPLTPRGPRYADICTTKNGLIAVTEEHLKSSVTNKLVFIDFLTGRQKILDEGHDFYSNPILSGDGKKLAWLTWDHPNMPWDSTQLWTAAFDSGELINKQCLAGKDGESIFQPQWSPQGTLYFVSDRSGWWNLHRYKNHKVENVYPHEVEFGLPQWWFGLSTWRFTGKAEEILCTYCLEGEWRLGLLNPDLQWMNPLPLEYTDYSQIEIGDGFAVFLAASPIIPRRLVKLDLKTYQVDFLGPYAEVNLSTGYFSIPETIAYLGAEGLPVYAYYYPPANKHYKGKPGTLPPLIVISHGGPTAMTEDSFALKVQFWTSRGFAVLDVNYGGSTGYGRAYRERLKGQWGVNDVEDCVKGAKFLAEKGLVDAEKMVIRGASAGGFTTLAALAFTDTFVGGASYSGVSDPELLTIDTHKFESRYLDHLIGPFLEYKEIYRQRSPYYHAKKFKKPVIFFHGADDPIVPVEHAEKMYEELKSKGIEAELNIYEKESHGFRQSKNVVDSLEKELQFYLKIFYSK
jgi:dipeptidyl aminopeptidase/acylaminoacyl peptidase